MARKFSEEVEERRRLERIEKEELLAQRTKKPRKSKPQDMSQETDNTSQESSTAANETPAQNTEPVKTEPVNTDISEAAKHQPATQWKPLGGDRIKRDYSSPVINNDLANTEIPEAPINVETVNTDKAADLLNKPLKDTNLNNDQGGGGSGNPTQSGPTPEKPTPINSEWNSLSPAEQHQAAELTADMLIGGYDKLHYFGREYIKVDDEEVIELHNDDKIDMNSGVIESDEDPENEVTIRDFWKDFNKQVDERFVVSEQFKNEVRPPLIRLCMKYGLGASDGLYLAYKFGEDAATKVTMLVGFKKTVNKMQEHFMKQHSKFKAQVEAEVQRRMEAAGVNNPTKKKTTPDPEPQKQADDQGENKDPNLQKTEPPVKPEGGEKV